MKEKTGLFGKFIEYGSDCICGCPEKMHKNGKKIYGCQTSYKMGTEFCECEKYRPKYEKNITKMTTNSTTNVPLIINKINV